MTACLAGQTPLQCGKYLVEHVDACADCHSPKTVTGAPDYSKALSGDPAFADLYPTAAAKGNVPTPNLTALTKEGWTKADIKDALLNGKRPDARGGGLFPIMPYFSFHNMSDSDADAIVEYILAAHVHRERHPGAAAVPDALKNVPLPVPPVALAKVPNTTLKATDAHYEEAMLGKYMAAQVGVCMEC